MSDEMDELAQRNEYMVWYNENLGEAYGPNYATQYWGVQLGNLTFMLGIKKTFYKKRKDDKE